ncbi:MAG: hypothetical protein WD079_04480, partial [Phycisphaeraceae bacterium]
MRERVWGLKPTDVDAVHYPLPRSSGQLCIRRTGTGHHFYRTHAAVVGAGLGGLGRGAVLSGSPDAAVTILDKA